MPATNFVRILLSVIFLLISLPVIASDGLDITVGYLERVVPPPTTLSNLDPVPDDEGLAGATLGMKDNSTTGKFLNQRYRLETVLVKEGANFAEAAKGLLAKTSYIVVKAPKLDLLLLADLPEAKNAILMNASAPDTILRGEDCRTNILHTLPSRAMLADALAQFAVKKRWTNWVMIEGDREGDRALGNAFERSATKFRLKLKARKTWKFDADMRRSAATELPLFTQDFPDHDLVVVADEPGDFARYIPYNTWLPRPVAGSEGLGPVAWSSVVEQHGAAQLQSRFGDLAGRTMRPIDYAAWAAVRAIGEAVTRTNSADRKVLRDYMLSDKFELGGFKGRKLTFRNWNGQLRQPIPLAHARAVSALAPLEGFLHQRNELDTLGLDQPESKCTAFGE